MGHPSQTGLGGDVGSLLPGYPQITALRITGNTSSQLFSGNAAPPATLGNNGDFYLRSDTPGTANQRIYVKSAGAWVGVV